MNKKVHTQEKLKRLILAVASDKTIKYVPQKLLQFFLTLIFKKQETIRRLVEIRIKK